MAGDAAEKAYAKLRSGGTAGPATATTSGAAPAPTPPTRYRIPIKGIGYEHPVNRGEFDGDIHTAGPVVRERGNKQDAQHFDLTDDGVNAAMGSWYQFSDDDRAALSKKMWFLGLLKDPNDFDGAYTVWKKAVEHSARFALTGREIDPRDVLDMLGDAEAGAGKRVVNQGPTSRRSIDLTDPETAKMWVTEAFQKSMGRDPEDAEIRALVDALHERQQKNPQVTTTTPTKWDENGNPIDATTTTTGGVDPNAFFSAHMAADPEAGAHQAAAELFPALLQALGPA